MDAFSSRQEVPQYTSVCACAFACVRASVRDRARACACACACVCVWIEFGPLGIIVYFRM